MFFDVEEPFEEIFDLFSFDSELVEITSVSTSEIKGVVTNATEGDLIKVTVEESALILGTELVDGSPQSMIA